MKKVISMLVTILLLTQTVTAYSQTSLNNFLGYWTFDKKTESTLIIITQEADRYKISLLTSYDKEPSDTWTASLNNNSLIGSNGAVIKITTNGQMKISNYAFDNSDENTLYKLNQLSRFFGIWKSSTSDKDFIKIYLEPSHFTPCKGTAYSYHIVLSKNKEGESPYNHQDLCGTKDSIKNEAVSIKYLSAGKIVVSWTEEKIYSKTYSLIYPTQTNSKTDYSNLNTFWTDFKNAALKKNKSKISQLTYFPFLKHGRYLTKEKFADYDLPDFVINPLKTAKAPVKSSMAFGGGSDGEGNSVTVNFPAGSLYEVSLGGPTLYFSKVNGEYKFVAVLYAE